MTEELVRLLANAPIVIESFALVFLRVGAAIFVLPVFGEMMVPIRVRLAAVFAFSLVVYPAIMSEIDVSEGNRILLQGFAEVMTGLAIGLVLRIHIMAIQTAATIAAQVTSLAQLLGGANVDPQPAIGMVLYLAALAMAVELGLHVQISRMFIMSYELVAVGTLIGASLTGVMTRVVANSFEFAFVLAAPFVAVSMAYNLTLGVINRAMPQLMVAFVGAPAITYGALVLLMLTAPLILTIWVHRFQQLILSPFGGN